MNGPQHYAEAERLLTASVEAVDDLAPNASDWYIRRAEVHATLALVAASAPGRAISPDSLPGRIEDGWAAVLS